MGEQFWQEDHTEIDRAEEHYEKRIAELESTCAEQSKRIAELEAYNNIGRAENGGLRFIIKDLEDKLATEKRIVCLQIDHKRNSTQRAEQAEADNARLQQWVNDLQSGMYINCVYCGYNYGPEAEVPATMADALKEHIEQCPKHPMSALKSDRDKLREALQAFVNAWDKRRSIVGESRMDSAYIRAKRALRKKG